MDSEKGYYKNWFEFLKESSNYRECCRNKGQGPLTTLYQDWGNIYDVTFEQWWDSHADLFSPKKMFTYEPIKNVKDFRDWSKGDNSVAIVAVHLLAPLTDLQASLRELVLSYEKPKSGRKKLDVTGGDYVLKAKPPLEFLKTLLAVHRQRKEKNEGKSNLTDVEIAKQLKKKGKLNQPDSELRSQVWRWRKQAEEIASNVEKGLYPVYKSR